MNKKLLVEHVASEVGLTTPVAREAVEAVLSGIAVGLKGERAVELSGFGRFFLEDVPERRMRRPGLPAIREEYVTTAAYTRVRFKAAAALQRRCNEK